jgi:hypothetical protein
MIRIIGKSTQRHDTGKSAERDLYTFKLKPTRDFLLPLFLHMFEP